MATQIHPSAIIDPAAHIGADVRIGPFSVVDGEVTIGDGCDIGSHVVLTGNTTLGKNNRIFPHNAIGCIPQDLKYNGEPTALTIGDNNTFREYMTVNTGTVGGGGATAIGNDNLFMAYVHVAHDCQVGHQGIFANGATLAGHVVVEDGAVIGGLTAIHQFARIGKLAMIGGCSAVDRDVPPFCLAIGNRAELQGLNLTGLKRAGVTRTDMRALRDAYTELFATGTPLKDAGLAVREKWPEHAQITALVDFLDASERGVCR